MFSVYVVTEKHCSVLSGVAGGSSLASQAETSTSEQPSPCSPASWQGSLASPRDAAEAFAQAVLLPPSRDQCSPSSWCRIPTFPTHGQGLAPCWWQLLGRRCPSPAWSLPRASSWLGAAGVGERTAPTAPGPVHSAAWTLLLLFLL